ncbi:hypothetical protein HD553DRAFT_305370 [Filobasidium floriforme]|uniref:uncharacterized protein n=1 Tax=Filobasidium floriforme TaxID=5210 RepID=UPI001E8CBA2F|nr:uncharacterized protein HD553DRAFT_305370 [Filobasidium floriforme]KAH8089206.1 hypothetical protein HD553DRAFT_305370 [Filobasidium floriforme]
MKFATTLALLASVAIGANAQTTPSQCVLTCSQQAATTAGCTSFADPSCVCTNVAFQNAAQQCLVANCTAEEQAQALSLQATLCPNGAVSGVSSIIPSSILTQTSSVALPTGAAASSISASVMSSMESESSMMSSSAAAASSTASSSSQGVVSSIASSASAAVSSAVSGASSRVSSVTGSTNTGAAAPAGSTSAPANGARQVEAWGMGGKVVAGVVGLVGVGGVMAFGF